MGLACAFARAKKNLSMNRGAFGSIALADAAVVGYSLVLEKDTLRLLAGKRRDGISEIVFGMADP
jgi:hypothetical protein